MNIQAETVSINGVEYVRAVMRRGDRAMEKRTVFFTMVMHPVTGWTRVGNAYPSRKAAADWLPFVRGAWPVRTERGLFCGQRKNKSLYICTRKNHESRQLPDSG